MPDYGVLPTGFNRKRLDVLLAEINEEVRAIFGDNINLSPESPDGQINGVVSESNANLWEIAEASYNAFNPSAASGTTLSNLVQLNGITRLEATKSTVLLTISGTTGTSVPAGSLVSVEDSEYTFVTNSTVVIGVGGTVDVNATAEDTGPIEASIGTVTVIETPVTGWDSVTNAAAANVGTNEETDGELRARRQRSVAAASQAIVDAIFSAVADIDGVTQVVVLENDTNATDANGLPPHSFNVIVEGGTETDIVQAIWLKKPAGILSFGTTTSQAIDSQGISHDISFSRPTTVDIYVTVTLTTGPEYPINGDALIKQAIVDYANGELVAGRGFFLSDDVIYTRLYTPINSVQGHEITDLRIGLSASPTGTANIAIAVDELANFLVDNIVVVS